MPSPRREPVVHGWPVLEAAAAHLAWMEDDLGWSWIHQRTVDLGVYARAALEDTAQIRLVTPAAHAGLLSIELAEGTSQSAFDRLTAEHMIVRHRPELDLLRISTAFFVTETEIDRFAATVRTVDGQRHPKYAS